MATNAGTNPADTEGTGSTTTGGPSSTTSPPPSGTTADTGTSSSEGSTTADSSTASGSSTTGESSTLLERVVTALGGEENLDALETFQLEAEGERRFVDEGEEAGGPPPTISTYTSTVSFETATDSILADVSRTVTLDALVVPQAFQEIIQGDLGHIAGVEHLLGFPTGDLASDRWGAITAEQRLLNPHLILRDVLDAEIAAVESGEADYDGRPHELLEIEYTVAPLVLWVDSETDLISRLTTLENHPLRRDVEIEVVYTDWSVATGVLFPDTVEVLMDGEVESRETRSSVTENPELGAGFFDFPKGAAPAFDQVDADRGRRNRGWHRSFAASGLPNTGLQTFVDATEIAPGVHLLGGSSHNSMAIEQANGVVIFDAPLYEARCIALLDWVDANLAGSATTHIVLSHHHVDHTACARTFVARGATLVVGEDAAEFWDTILAAPSTVEPDELELDPVGDPMIEVVPTDGALVLDDVVLPVEVFDVVTGHSNDMVIPFVGGTAGALFTVDLFSPGLPFAVVADGAQEVLDSLAFHGITNDVNVVVGGHGGVGTVADIVTAAGG